MASARLAGFYLRVRRGLNVSGDEKQVQNLQRKAMKEKIKKESSGASGK